MAVTDEDVKQARQDALNEKNQRRMEKEVYGEMTPENPLIRGKRKTFKELESLTDRPVQKYPSKSLQEMMEPLKKAKGGKIKKYADGGMTQQPTYPFYGNQPQAGGQNGGMNQTFNMQPQAMAGPNDQMGQQQRFKKGGQVKASAMKSVKVASPKMGNASKRADGIAQRGKTRGRMV